MYRSTWARNTLLRERLAVSARALGSAGVPFLLVGSIGAARRYYATLGLRPTPVIELLVRNDDAVAAVKALGSAGWVARGPGRASHADPVVLLDDGENAYLLSTALGPDVALPSPYGPLWDAATDLDEQGVPVKALAPTDDLLAAIVAGARTRPAPSLQWILDAAMIQRSVPDELDWGTAGRSGARLGAGASASRGARVPRRSSRRLRAGRRPPDARRSAARSSRANRLTAARARWGVWARSAGGGRASGRDRWPDGHGHDRLIPGFLRRRWRLERTRQVPLAGARRAYRVALRRRGSRSATSERALGAPSGAVRTFDCPWSRGRGRSSIAIRSTRLPSLPRSTSTDTTASVLVRRGYGDPAGDRLPRRRVPRARPFALGDMRRPARRFAPRSPPAKICVHGDYDVDGICATALAVLMLRELGADVDGTCPAASRRATAGGETLERLAGRAAGSSSPSTAASLRSTRSRRRRRRARGRRHRPPPPGRQLPDCPIVATRPSDYPFPELCGTGVVYKLAEAQLGPGGRALAPPRSRRPGDDRRRRPTGRREPRARDRRAPPLGATRKPGPGP